MTPETLARLFEQEAARGGDPAAAFMEAVAAGPLDDPAFVLDAIRLAFRLGLAEAPAIANTLEILINPPEPDWTGDEEA